MSFRTFTVAAMLLVAALPQLGCYRAIVRGGPKGAMEPESRTEFNLLWGLTDAEVDAPDCPNGLARVETYLPWYSGLVQLFTLGIVTPHKVQYVCAQAAAP